MPEGRFRARARSHVAVEARGAIRAHASEQRSARAGPRGPVPRTQTGTGSRVGPASSFVVWPPCAVRVVAAGLSPKDQFQRPMPLP